MPHRYKLREPRAAYLPVLLLGATASKTQRTSEKNAAPADAVAVPGELPRTSSGTPHAAMANNNNGQHDFIEFVCKPARHQCPFGARAAGSAKIILPAPRQDAKTPPLRRRRAPQHRARRSRTSTSPPASGGPSASRRGPNIGARCSGTSTSRRYSATTASTMG